MKTQLMFAVIILCIVCVCTSTAQIPRIISYQGILTDSTGTPKQDGIYTFTFRLYGDSSGGSSLWMEIKDIQTKRGLFTTRLGDQASFAPAISFNRQYWLGIKVGAEAEMPLRVPISAVAYSLNSVKSDTASYSVVAGSVPNASITETKIANFQVVKGLNNLKDNVYLSAQGGATITTRRDTIIINAGTGGGGTGIQGIQNTNSTLDILNPNGPTATVNVKSPLSLSDTVNNLLGIPIIYRGVITGSNAGSGSGILGKSTVNGTGVTGLATGTGKAGYFKIDNDASAADALVGQTGGSGDAIYGYQFGTGRAGYFAIINAANTNIALQSQTNGTGSAIYSVNSGTGMAGHFYTSNASNDHAALRAETNGTGPGFHSYVTGTGMAGHFQVDNTSNGSYALYSETNGLNGKAGYFGINNSSNPRAAVTVATNGLGNAILVTKTGNGPGDAVDVTMTGTSGRAGNFEINNTSSTVDALYGITNGSGDAIQGTMNGSGAGVRGTCGSSTGRAGWFEISNASNGNTSLLGKTFGLGRAGWFEIDNPANENSALVGKTNGGGNAVIGQNVGFGNAGLFEIVNSVNPTTALRASTNGIGAAIAGYSINRGVVGVSTANQGVGVLGESQGVIDDSNYGVFSNGKMGATGAKLAVVPIGVPDPKNRKQAMNAPEWRGLYCVESTELWFEDFGYGTLAGGSVTIQLDDIFTQTVNTKLPYHIFITPYGESKPLYVTNKTANSFTVVESGSGNSSIEFSYRIVAKRLGYEGTRLEKINPASFLGTEESANNKSTKLDETPTDSEPK
jgi:hypothetical protein